MPRIITLAMAVLAIPATVANANASYCDQTVEIATAQLRAAPAHANNSAPHESCKAYSNHFFEAVKARQTVSICENSVQRQRALDMLDSEIDAFNNLIASQCGEP